MSRVTNAQLQQQVDELRADLHQLIGIVAQSWVSNRAPYDVYAHNQLPGLWDKTRPAEQSEDEGSGDG